MSAFEHVMSVLQDRGERVIARGGKARTRGVCHDGDDPDTVSIGIGRDKRVLIHCFKCEGNEDFLTAVGLTEADLYEDSKDSNGGRRTVVKSYPYHNEDGTVRYYIDRYVPKAFLPRMADGSKGFPREARILYRLPAVLAAARSGGTIFICEGEKDADNLVTKADVTATTMPGGTGMGWLESYSTSLVGSGEVVILADRDEAGAKHVRKVAASLNRRGIPHRIMQSAVGKDVSDHLAAGLGYDDLVPFGTDRDAQPSGTEDQTADDSHGQEEDEVPERRLILQPASQIRTRVVRWLWDTTPEGAPPTSHGRIPLYSLAIAAGAPGLGKSQYAVWMTARITTGTLPGELWGKPRAVIYAAAEDSWSYTIAPRLIAAGADMDLVLHVDVKDDGQAHARLTLPLDTSLLGKEAELHSVALLVMDPLLSYIDKGINDYRAAEVRQALEPLVNAADRHCFTILGLAHFTKFGAADPLARVAGSGAFGQLIRCLVAFAKEDTQDGEQRFVMSLEKNNLGRLGLPSHAYEIQSCVVQTDEGPSYVSRFVLGSETNTSVSEVMREESMPEGGKGEANENVEWLRGYLTDMGGSDEAADVKKAARKNGISDSAIDRAKRKLGVKAQHSGFGKDRRSHWYLPEAAPRDEAS